MPIQPPNSFIIHLQQQQSWRQQTQQLAECVVVSFANVLEQAWHWCQATLLWAAATLVPCERCEMLQLALLSS
jgi:hypothetical protein